MNSADAKYAAYRVLNAFGFKGVHTCLQPSSNDMAFVIRNIGIPSVKINGKHLEFYACPFNTMHRNSIVKPFLKVSLESEGLPEDRSRRAKLINKHLHFNPSYTIFLDILMPKATMHMNVSHLFFKAPTGEYEPTFIIGDTPGTFTDVESLKIIEWINERRPQNQITSVIRKLVGVYSQDNNLN